MKKLIAMEAFNIMKTKFIIMVLAIVVLSCGISFGQSITLESVTGTMWHDQPDSMMTGEIYTFNLRVTNNAIVQTGLTNGFRVYSPDGAEWTTTVGTATDEIQAFFTSFFFNSFSVSGTGADTIGFGSILFGVGGLTADYDAVAYSITVGSIPTGATHHGQTICLDSSYFPPAGTWKWAGVDDTGLVVGTFPDWGGPYCYTVIDEGTDISDNPNGIPTSFGLSQNYPNPFNPATKINFVLPVKSDVHLTIYNVTGQQVKEFSGTFDAGYDGYFEWDAATNSSGIYFYKLTAGDFTETKKMMLLK